MAKKKLKNRTVAPDGQAIQRLRIEKGWTADDLRRKVGCSLRTAENIERGKNCYVTTLRYFAEALGVEVPTLMVGTGPPPRTKQRTWEITVKISTPCEEFDQSTDLIQCMKTLIDRLGGQVLEPEEIRKGSPKVAFEGTSHPRTADFLSDLHRKFAGEPLNLDDEGTRIHFFATGNQIRRLIELYKDGRLDDMGITMIFVLYARTWRMCRFGGNKPFWAHFYPALVNRVNRFLGDDGPDAVD